MLGKYKVVLIIELIIIAFLLGVGVSQFVKSEVAAEDTYEKINDKSQIRQIADNYLTVATYSKQGLIDALCTYEHLDRKATKEVVNNLDTDWQKQADKEVDEYLHMDGNSESRIRECMERDKFTQKQIDKAIKKADPDWTEQAKLRVEILMKAGANALNARIALADKGFTDTQIEEAMEWWDQSQ